VFLIEDNSKKPNRLINEKSPYLLQHAYNPVNWYPWCDDAFKLSKKENKPIFVSIGYSTCHWCHVMERESFEDQDVANVLNENFISIKVDREERPDIDHIYMDVCNALTGRGGWPLTVFIDENQKPFYAGTYYPKDMLIDLLTKIKAAWDNNKNGLVKQAEGIINFINKNDETNKKELNEDIIHKCFKNFSSQFSEKYGGFNRSPKFPSPHNLYFLLRYYYIYKNEEALKMVLKTLNSMYKGGIYDHIGYGFCRYSTDDKWLVPHFEKMLYDNALISMAYLEAYLITKDEKYKEICIDTLTYVLRDMKSEGGGFYSAEDADSEGVEGKFYLWTMDEVIKVLGEKDGREFCEKYDITVDGNFEGLNIPNLIKSDDIKKDFKNSIKKLFDYRENRIHPFKDDKILTSWNGLMIAALSMAGKAFNNEDFTRAAKEACDFIFEKMVDQNGKLMARYRNGESAYLAYAEDYAYLIWGLIELYETTFDGVYLKRALDLNHEFIDNFWDGENGGLFIYGKDSRELITRPKNIYDSAMPSANSVAISNFIRLSGLSGDQKLMDMASKTIEAFGEIILENPTPFSNSLIGLMYLKNKRDLVLVSDDKNEILSMIHIVNDEFNPFLSYLGYFKGSDLEKINEDLVYYKMMNGKVTAYLCEKNTCHEPIYAEKLNELLYN